MIGIDEMLDELLRTIGVADIGKERWFSESDQRRSWYDRKTGQVIDRDELSQVVCKTIREIVDDYS